MKEIIISVFNNKGGTGKTTSTINIGAVLHSKGFKVLLIDLDAQANLSKGLKATLDYSILDSLKSKKIDTSKLFIYKDNFHILTSSLDMVNLDKFLDSERVGKDKKIKKILDDIKGNYDFILIDNPPNFSLSVINSLFASDYFLSPMEVDFFSQIGLQNLYDLIEDINQEREKNIECLGLFLTRYIHNRKIGNYLKKELSNHFVNDFLNVSIRQNIRLTEAQMFGEDIVSFDKTSNGYLDYLTLTNTLLKRIK